MEKKLSILKNENKLFDKIKDLFLNLFKRDKTDVNVFQGETKDNNTSINFIENQNDIFMKSVRNIENEETKLLKLQRQFENGEIDTSQLSQEQIADLTILYKKQIGELKKSNEIRKQKLLLYRKNGKI